MFASASTAQAQNHDDDDDDDDDDEEDFLQARRNLKGRSAAASEQQQPARRSLPSREETPQPRPNPSSMSSAPPHASGTKAEDEMNSDEEAEAKSESTSDEDMVTGTQYMPRIMRAVDRAWLQGTEPQCSRVHAAHARTAALGGWCLHIVRPEPRTCLLHLGSSNPASDQSNGKLIALRK